MAKHFLNGLPIFVLFNSALQLLVSALLMVSAARTVKIKAYQALPVEQYDFKVSIQTQRQRYAKVTLAAVLLLCEAVLEVCERDRIYHGVVAAQHDEPVLGWILTLMVFMTPFMLSLVPTAFLNIKRTPALFTKATTKRTIVRSGWRFRVVRDPNVGSYQLVDFEHPQLQRRAPRRGIAD